MPEAHGQLHLLRDNLVRPMDELTIGDCTHA